MSKHQVITIIFVAALFILWCLKQAVVVNPLWYVVLGMGYLACNAYGAVVLSTQYFTPVKWKAPHARGIALTFDDGPVPGHTEEILNILKTHGIKATFFCIGHRVNSYPEIAQRIHEEGHLLANHSYWHSKTFDLQSSGKMLKELKDTDAAINTHVGVSPRFFRPPYGVTNPMLAKAIRRGNYCVVGWSIRSFDTVTKDREKLLRRVTNSLRNGDIILFHDYSEATRQMLPELIKYILTIGVKIVSLDTLLNENAYRQPVK